MTEQTQVAPITRFEHVHVIINPASGKGDAILQTLNKVLNELGLKWEMLVTTSSERQGRVIDQDPTASMEKKKLEGYF